MRPYLFSPLVLFYFFINSLLAQNFELKQTPLKGYSYLNYLGQDNAYLYYASGENKFTRFSLKNPVDIQDISYVLDEDWRTNQETYFRDNKLISISASPVTIEKTRQKSFRFNLYSFDPNSGKKIKKAHFEYIDSMGADYSYEMDTVINRILITKSDSVVKAYNFDMEETEDRMAGKVKKRPDDINDLSAMLQQLIASMHLNFNFSIDVGNSKPDDYKDSSSLDHYRVSFERRKDEDIYFFKSVIQKIEIKSKHANNKVQDIEFSIDVDKSVLDINYSEDKNGRLVFFGKYMVKGKSNSQYGMFSVIYDIDLNEASGVKYFDLGNIPNFNQSVPNSPYIGFIFSKLFSSDYDFYLEEENVFIYTYQKSFSNLQDHIYLLKIESNGEITVNTITNRLSNDNKSDNNEKHMALRVGNKIHFIFYDHLDNLGKPAFEKEFVVGNIAKKSCVLVTCTYHVMEDDFTNRKIISDKKTLKMLPHLMDPVLFFDSSLNQYICTVKGLDKNRNVAMLYQFRYVE